MRVTSTSPNNKFMRPLRRVKARAIPPTREQELAALERAIAEGKLKRLPPQEPPKNDEQIPVHEFSLSNGWVGKR